MRMMQIEVEVEGKLRVARPNRPAGVTTGCSVENGRYSARYPKLLTHSASSEAEIVHSEGIVQSKSKPTVKFCYCVLRSRCQRV